MMELGKRLFVGIKISKSLQHELDTPVPGTQHYLEAREHLDYLQVINFGEHKIIGKYIEDGCPAAAIAEVSLNVCRIVKLMTRGRRIEENEVHIYTGEALAI
ncbi:MAG: hypothetical protein ACM3SP_12065 [Chloroflexota bacterium]